MFVQIKRLKTRFIHGFRIVINLFCIFSSSLIRKKENKWVFGSWFGNEMSDNPYYLSKYIIAHKNEIRLKELKLVWIVKEIPKKSDHFIKYVKKNSLNSIIDILTAKVAIFNQGYEDICDYNILGGVYKVQLWHGVPWKKIGFDISESPNSFIKIAKRKIHSTSIQYNLYTASSEETKKRIISAFDVNNRKVLTVGQPRNEVFFNSVFVNDSRKRIIEMMNLDKKTIIISYLPTFRDHKDNSFSFLDSNYLKEKKAINELLRSKNAIIIEKRHYVDKSNNKPISSTFDRMTYVSKIDTQELLAASDILITDYSSCLFDYLLLNRPIIQFLYDYCYYKNDDRGLYYKKEEVSCGQIVYSLSELKNEIDLSISNPHLFEKDRLKVKSRFCKYETAHNSKVIINHIFQEIE